MKVIAQFFTKRKPDWLSQILSWLTALLLLFAPTAMAQLPEGALPPKPPLRSGSGSPPPQSTQDTRKPTTPSCFQYYHFGSVTVALNPGKQSYQAGESAKFSGYVINTNSYPLVNGSLVLRISQANPRSQVGDDIIEEWVALEHLNLNAGERYPIEFTRQLSSDLPTGSYALTSFYLTADKFNLSGLSFADDLFASYTTFSVVGKSGTSIRFDRTGVVVNGYPYRIFGFLPIFPATTTELAVRVPLKNETAKQLDATISYALYSWDAREKNNLLKTWDEKVSLSGNGTTDLNFSIDARDRVVYFTVIKAQAMGRQSEIHIRFAKEGFRPRLNFVGIDKFPLADGDRATLFACYHNMTQGNANGKVELELSDARGKRLQKATYDGNIAGNIAVLVKEFTAPSTMDRFTLSANVYNDKNQLVDTVKMEYDCARFRGIRCAETTQAAQSRYYYWAGIGFLLAAVVFLYVRRRQRMQQTAHE